jgi:hypothetical protein
VANPPVCRTFDVVVVPFNRDNSGVVLDCRVESEDGAVKEDAEVEVRYRARGGATSYAKRCRSDLPNPHFTII